MDDTAVFVELRPHLFAIAYRMLSSATEADDVLQEAYLRWSRRPATDVESPGGYLSSVVVRLSIDQLRSARRKREAYVGQWLPEPVSTEPDPAEAAELADSLSLAFLVLMEELSPAVRAAFILREVFDYSYPEIAGLLGRSEPACRQLVSRGKHQIGDRRPHFDRDRRGNQELVDRFGAACIEGNLGALLELLAPDVVVWSDGGGKAAAAPRPVVGAERAARFLINVVKRIPAGVDIRSVVLNGQPGTVIEEGGRPVNATVFDVVGGVICGIRIVANPEKLGALTERSGAAGDEGGVGGGPLLRSNRTPEHPAQRRAQDERAEEPGDSQRRGA